MSNNDKKRKNSEESEKTNKKTKVDELDSAIKKQIDIINQEKNMINNEIYSSFRRIDNLRSRIRELDKKLNKVCPHKWVRDWDQYEPCGRTPKICEFCGL